MFELNFLPKIGFKPFFATFSVDIYNTLFVVTFLEFELRKLIK